MNWVALLGLVFAAPTWRVDPSGALAWQGEPYMPLGMRIEGTVEAVREAHAAGAGDVVVDLGADGAGWSDVVRELEQHRMRYVIAITTPLPSATGVIVEPEGYRVTGIASPRNLELPIPGAGLAMAILASQPLGAIEQSEIATARDGVLRVHVDPGNELQHVLLVYPMVQGAVAPDYWEGWDARRDAVLRAFTESPPGPGLRGVLDPAGPVDFDALLQAVPTSPSFRVELESHIRRRYTTIETAWRAWALSAPDVTSFAELARVVPLWSAARGVGALWDPDSGRLLICDQRRSAAWRDIREVVAAAQARRFQRLADAIRSKLDVPVVQSWRGWSGPYAAGLDGVGMGVVGSSPVEQIASAAPAASSALRSTRPAWLLATLPGGPPQSVVDALDDLASIGARAWFVEARTAAERALLAPVLAHAERIRLLATSKPEPIFYPESATNPAAPMRVVGGRWWLPTPEPGERIDLGERYSAYMSEPSEGTVVVLWSSEGPRRVKLRYLEAAKVQAEAVDGSDPKPRVRRSTLELTLGPVPVVLRGSPDFPVPEEAFVETAEGIQALFKAGAESAAMPDEQLIYKDAVASFERNPAGSYAVLRMQYKRLLALFARYAWVECEASRDVPVGEQRAEAGVSNGQVLAMRPRLPTPDGFGFSLPLDVREAGRHDVWLAARLPRGGAAWITASIGDQTLRIESGPVSLYGAGFGWYRFGSVDLARGKMDVRVGVNAPLGTEMAFDVLVASPGGFRPDGPRPPAK